MSKGKFVKCDKCKGKGTIPMNPVGRGMAVIMTGGISEIIGTSKKCTKCNGKGRVFLDDRNNYR